MESQTKLVGVNSFVLRQVRDSKYSHFEGDWTSLADLAEWHFDSATPGYRDGVILVPVHPQQFKVGVTEVTSHTVLKASFSPRKKGEAPYIQISAIGGVKAQALYAELVLYRRDVLLEEGPDAVSTDCEWEIVSINARTTEEPEPLTPVAMARNFLARTGGTKGEFSAEDFAKSIEYWSSHCMIE